MHELYQTIACLIQDIESRLDRKRRLRIVNQRYLERMTDPSRGVSQEEFDKTLAGMGLSE